MIRIYTDGAAKGNPGPGGYGVILKYNDHVKELSQGYRLTTNNRMELLAVITGLEAIKKEGIPVTIYSDSEYVVNAVEKGWIWGWEKRISATDPMPIFGNAIFPCTKNSIPNSSGSAAMPVILKTNVVITWR